jgi:hypothetical protein
MSDPVPKTWVDAVPSVLFGFYGLGCALEAVSAMNHGNINLFVIDSIACIVLTAIAVVWWKHREWLPAKLVSTTTLVVTDARWLIGAASVLILASALSPYVEQRRWPFTHDRARLDVATTGPVTQSEATLSDVGALIWNPDRRQGGAIEWNTGFGTTRSADRLINLYIQGINASTSAVRFRRAYLASRITGKTIEMMVDAGAGGILRPNQINPVPWRAPIRLIAEINPPNGMALSDFLNEWKDLDFVAEYDSTEFRLHFNEAAMAFQFPGVVGPHVTKREGQ